MASPHELLDAHHLRKTRFRERVLDIFLQHARALSQKDIEDALLEADRITLYRTLKTFEEYGLIHKAIDGSDKLKYALCHAGCGERAHHDDHAHFHCDNCGQTFCVEDIKTPVAAATPPGFTIANTCLIINGRCAQCAQ